MLKRFNYKDTIKIAPLLLTSINYLTLPSPSIVKGGGRLPLPPSHPRMAYHAKSCSVSWLNDDKSKSNEKKWAMTHFLLREWLEIQEAKNGLSKDKATLNGRGVVSSNEGGRQERDNICGRQQLTRWKPKVFSLALIAEREQFILY